MKKNKRRNSDKFCFFLILSAVFDLAFLYFIKYQNQLIGFSSFSFLPIGNLLNLIISSVFILIILVLLKTGNELWRPNYFKFILISNQVFLIFSYLSTFFQIFPDNQYILSQQADKIFTGFLFTLYQFSSFIMIFLVWFSLFKDNNMVFIRSILNSMIVFLLIFILTFIYIVSKESSISKETIKTNNNSIAVVLGAAVWSGNQPSPSLAARADKAVELLDKGMVKSIYLTGSNAPGELSESEVAKRYILSRRNNAENIFTESETRSTIEQIKFIEKLSRNKNFSNIFVVSDSYHLVRVSEICYFHKLKVTMTASNFSFSFEKALFFKIREALALTMFWFFGF